MTTGWQRLTAAIAEAGAQIAGVAPDAATAGEGEAYVTRIVTAGLAGAVLGHLFREDGLSRALPCHGGPNPDYRMFHSPIDPARSYRLSGQLNGSERVGVGLYRFGENGTLLAAGYAAFDAESAAPDGTFALDMSPDAAGPGSLALQPGTKILLIRVLHRGPASQAADLALEGPPAATGLALMTGSNDGALAFVAASLGNTVREYLKWTETARDLANRLGEAPAHLTATVQGDPDTVYLLGGFVLDEGEWLEVTMPAGLAGYWSLHAYNYWFEPLQTPGLHDRNAVAASDGTVTVAIGPDTPASAPNRIDTGNRGRGALICRIIGGLPDRPSARVRHADKS
ncbi:MAG: hypothetical protein ABIT04_11210 [Novosphingobium sp.]